MYPVRDFCHPRIQVTVHSLTCNVVVDRENHKSKPYITRPDPKFPYIKYQTKYSYTLTEFARMLLETVLERISLIDLLSCTHYTCYKASVPDLQLLLF